jgi:hypothetical protein
MVSVGTTFKCQNCKTEVEVISAHKAGGPLVCCETEMSPVGNEFEQIWENEAYDAEDFNWD